MPRRSSDVDPIRSVATVAADELRLLFGANLRCARLKAGLTQAEVHRLTAIRQNYVSEIENGLHNPTLTTMATLAQAVGTNVPTLLKPPPKRRQSGRQE